MSNDKANCFLASRLKMFLELIPQTDFQAFFFCFGLNDYFNISNTCLRALSRVLKWILEFSSKIWENEIKNRLWVAQKINDSVMVQK